MFVNFDKLMDKEISALKKQGVKPKLLLHSCCAPCFSGCIHRLTQTFEVIVYFYNPNIDGVEEYVKRAEEQKRLCLEFGLECIVEDYNSKEFFDNVKGYEECLEGGDRCGVCFELRLENTAKKAKRLACEYFATTLTLSPLKNAQRINAIGDKIGEKIGVKYLVSDFKKKGGYQISLERSKEYSLYRQNYCGCVFSKNKNPNR